MKRFFRFFNVLILDSVIILISRLLPASRHYQTTLVRLDSIGDYILFRNFIEISYRYDGPLFIIGNIVFKDLFITLDEQFCVDHFWIDYNKFYSNWLYRTKAIFKLSRIKTKHLVNSTYSREFYVSDSICRAIRANLKTAHKPELSNLKTYERFASNTFYNQLVSTTDKVVFEYQRNKIFFERLYKTKLERDTPYISNDKLSEKPDSLPSEFVLIFSGAQNKFRRWNIDNYIAIARYIHDKTGISTIWCCQKSDLNDGDFERITALGDLSINLIGQTSLTDLLGLIKNSRLVLSNESCVPHMCIALDKEVLTISNGNFFGRFTPYIPNNEYYQAFYPPDIESNRDDIQSLVQKYSNGSSLNINEIKPENILPAVAAALVEKNSSINPTS